MIYLLPLFKQLHLTCNTSSGADWQLYSQVSRQHVRFVLDLKTPAHEGSDPESLCESRMLGVYQFTLSKRHFIWVSQTPPPYLTPIEVLPLNDSRED